MPTRKPKATIARSRVTVAMLREQENRASKWADLADAREAEAIKAQAEAAHLAGELANLRAAAEPEATALAGCVRAIEAMYAAQRAADRASANTTYRDGISYSQAQGPYSPHASPVGRILLHLAARYGVPLVAPAPEPAPESVLVQAPAHLAGALRELLGHQ